MQYPGTQFPPVDRLLPHGPPMRLVDAVVAESEDGLVCRARIGDDFVFLRDGEAEIAVCVELVAQTVGCLVGLRDVREGRAPKPGLLVGCRDARFHAEKLRRGDELTIEIKTQWIREPVASFVGSVVRADDVLADVELVVVSAEGDLAEAYRGAHGD